MAAHQTSGEDLGDAIPDDCSITLAGAVAGEPRPGDVFDVDPALGSAYLKITRKGVTHEVSWTASDDLAPVTSAYPCGPLPAAPTGAGAVRPAMASGTVFGKPVTAASADGGFASLSVQAFGC